MCGSQSAATDATIYERYQNENVKIFEIGSSMPELQEFVNVFGNRFPGLHDPGSAVYSEYRIPHPEAPYPQDYIIDQEGRVAYWAGEYEPQEIIDVIDRLLGIQETIEELTITHDGDNINLSWEPVSIAHAYNIYIGDEPGFAPIGDPYAGVPGNVTEWSAALSTFAGQKTFFKVTYETEIIE